MAWMRSSRVALNGGADPFAKPGGEFLFCDLPSGEGKHQNNALGLCETQHEPVLLKEKPRQNPSGSLVAIDKRMVFGHSISVCRGERRRIGIAIDCEIFGPCQGRKECAVIPNSSRTTMLC